MEVKLIGEKAFGHLQGPLPTIGVSYTGQRRLTSIKTQKKHGHCPLTATTFLSSGPTRGWWSVQLLVTELGLSLWALRVAGKYLWMLFVWGSGRWHGQPPEAGWEHRPLIAIMAELSCLGALSPFFKTDAPLLIFIPPSHGLLDEELVREEVKSCGWPQNPKQVFGCQGKETGPAMVTQNMSSRFTLNAAHVSICTCIWAAARGRLSSIHSQWRQLTNVSAALCLVQFTMIPREISITFTAVADQKEYR